MGEVIREIREVSIGGGSFMIELNHGTENNRIREIHVQNDKFRLSIPEPEFLQMAACILLAKRQLEVLKGKEKLENLVDERR